MKYVLKGQNGSLDIPHLIISPSYACNISCKHCYNDDIGDGVTQEQWKDVIDRWGDGIVHFKGGEPFAFNGLNELMNHAADKGNTVFVTSNGTLIDDKEAQRLGKVYQKTNGKILLSLNGSKPEIDEQLRPAGAYEQTVDGTKRLRNNQVLFDINYVVHSGNEHDVEQAAYLAKELGAVQFNLLPLVLRGDAKVNELDLPRFEAVLPQLERAANNGCSDILEWSAFDMIQKLGTEYSCDGCVAGFKGFAYITPDGNVYSCPNTVAKRLGTINDSFENIFNSEEAQRLRESHQGKLVCKGELEAYDGKSMENIIMRDELIKREIGESESKKKLSLCFNRNF
jgi:MoaA/NifB/PqqE/SkfB family radical SAM enzyme